MTGELTAQCLIDFRSPSYTQIPVVTVVFPGSNTRRYSIKGRPVESSVGVFRDRLVSMAAIDYRLSDPRGGLQSVSTTFQIEDIDGDVRSILQRYGPSSLRGSAISIDYATKRDEGPISGATTPADWPRLFTGVLDGIDPVSGMEWRIAARVDDRAFVDGSFRVPRVSAIDYPKVVSPNLERLIPVYLGQFDARDGTTTGSTGSVELIRLGESDGTGGFAYKYLVCTPYASYVGRVYVDGTAVAAANWVRTYTARHGLGATEVWLASDPGASARVTADLYGVGENVAGYGNYSAISGTGQPIVNIVKQMRWLFRNYLFEAYRTGAHFVSDPAALDTTTWDAAETWAEQRRFRGSFALLDVGQKPINVFNAFCQWAWIQAGWTRTGKLALYPFEPMDAPYVSDTRWVRLKWSEPFLPSLPRDRTVHQMRSESWAAPAAEASQSVVSVRDSRVIGNVVASVNSGWSVARQEFQDGYPGPEGLTLALNASRVGRQGSASYLAHAGNLTKWRDSNWTPDTSGTDFPNSNRTDKTMTAPGGNEPKWYAGGINGHGFVRFDGVNDYMAAASSGGVIVAAEFTAHAVFRVSAASALAANAWDHDLIIGDDAGVWGLFVYSSGGLTKLRAYNFDGTSDVVDVTISLNTWYVARMRHYGGNLYLAIDNWGETSVASGNSTAVTGTARVGKGLTAKYLTGDIAAAFLWSSGNLAVQGATTGVAVNISPALGGNWDMFQTLKDRYRL